MHRCVKKHQNVRIRDPPVPHFPYVRIRDPQVPNNVIGKKHLLESDNRLFVVGRVTVKNRPIQHFSHIFKSENRRFWCFHFKFGIRESPVPIILWNSCNEPKGLLPFVDNWPHIGVWRLPKFTPQYFSSRDLDRIWRPRSSRARSAWTPGSVSENHPGSVSVQTNGATCQAVTKPSRLERPWWSAWTPGLVTEPMQPKSSSSVTHLVTLYIRLDSAFC
jgi:hypothetical protein